MQLNLEIGRDRPLGLTDRTTAKNIFDRALWQGTLDLECHERAVPLSQRRLDVFSVQFRVGHS